MQPCCGEGFHPARSRQKTRTLGTPGKGETILGNMKQLKRLIWRGNVVLKSSVGEICPLQYRWS